MSEILNEFIIQPTEALFTVEPTNLTVNPEAIQLNVYTGAAPVAGGSNTNVQFNEDGVLQGSNSFTFNNVTEEVTIDDLIIGNVANLGGTANVKISGGTNGYVLQTDGTGNLSWTAQTGNGGGGNGVPGGSNTQIQFNNAGNFGGAAGFTFNSASNVTNVPGNLIAAGEITANYFNGNIANANLANYAGYVVNGNQSNITAVGTLANLTVAGTIAGNVINTTGDITSNTNITANGNFVGNLWGQANTAATVTTNAQPNITSVGTLTGLSLSGTLNAGGQTIISNVANANTINAVDLNVTGNANLNLGNITVAGNVSASRFISTVATGTPPLTVISTTLVPNLSVQTSSNANSINLSSLTSNTGHNIIGCLPGLGYSNVGTLLNLSYNPTQGVLNTYQTDTQYTKNFTQPVANLGNVYGSTAGMRAMVTNANTTTFNAVVGGGGSNVIPVFYDGTNWRVG
jgi:hypothetical protein